MSTVAMPLIRPISDLRTNLNEVCEEAANTQEPIIMTKNGKPALVVMDSDAYQQQKQYERYVHKIREAEIEERYLKATVPADEVRARMEAILANWSA